MIALPVAALPNTARAADAAPSAAEIVVTARRLDSARADIEPDLGASSYSMPQALIEKDAKDDTDKLIKQTTALRHLDAVANWRHQFAAYYYMLTGYRGRVVTTPDGVDDNAYWEFGQPTDDAASFTCG